MNFSLINIYPVFKQRNDRPFCFFGKHILTTVHPYIRAIQIIKNKVQISYKMCYALEKKVYRTRLGINKYFLKFEIHKEKLFKQKFNLQFY